MPASSAVYDGLRKHSPCPLMTTMGADGILGCKSAMSGKPEGLQTFPLEPRVQGRFAGIDMAEDVLLTGLEP